MIITCENCESRFRFEESRIPPQGAQVRCSRCGSSFFVPYPEEQTQKEESSLDQLPAAQVVKDEEEDLLNRTLAEFHADLSESQSGIDPGTEDHAVTHAERSELFAVELEALGEPEDAEKEDVAVEGLDLAFDTPEPGGEASNSSPSLSSSDSNLQQERREKDAEDDDSSMVGLLEPLAHESSGEEENLDGLGSPEEWDLIGDSRVDPIGGEPPRAEDLSGSGLGLEDLFIPDSKRGEGPVRESDESLAVDEEDQSFASVQPAMGQAIDEQADFNASPSATRGVVLAKQVVGWTASLLLLCYAGYANFPKWSESPTQPAVFHAVQLEGMALRDIQVRQIENLGGSALLVVSGKLSRDPSRGSQATLPVAALKGPVEKSEATFGLALPTQTLRERDPLEIQELLNASGQALAQEPQTGRTTPVEAVFEVSLVERRELQFSTQKLSPTPTLPMARENAVDAAQENVGGQVVADSATTIKKTESRPSLLLPSAPTE